MVEGIVSVRLFVGWKLYLGVIDIFLLRSQLEGMYYYEMALCKCSSWLSSSSIYRGVKFVGVALHFTRLATDR